MSLTDFYIILVALLCGFSVLLSVHYGRLVMFVLSMAMTGILTTAPPEVGFVLLLISALVVTAWVRIFGWKLP